MTAHLARMASFALILSLAFSFACTLTLCASAEAQDDHRSPLAVGVARVDITPDSPIRLSGYGPRRHPTGEVGLNLWAKALAIGEGDETVLLVTADLIGIPDWVADELARRLAADGFSRDRIAVTATHTHNGPQVNGVLPYIFGQDLPAQHEQVVNRYSDQLPINSTNLPKPPSTIVNPATSTGPAAKSALP